MTCTYLSYLLSNMQKVSNFEGYLVIKNRNISLLFPIIFWYNQDYPVLVIPAFHIETHSRKVGSPIPPP